MPASGTPVAIVTGGATGVGAATALELAAAEASTFGARARELRDLLESGLTASISGARVNACGAQRLPHLSNVAVPGVDSDALVVRLDLEGIAVSAGSACTAGAAQRSHVIEAIGASPGDASIRFSLGRATERRHIESVLERLPGIVAGMREFPAFVGTT